ncbi:uncharacterized protein [Antedon mediterranea]|uniref:uncharacterized protein n=1 Tax=Antedon mediterranea TaxID=105859 RepID=UPI003AF55EAC
MMDSFLAAANDLDKLLDEFEQNEEEHLYNHRDVAEVSLQKTQEVNQKISPISCQPESEFILDLSEADFGPASLNSSLNLTSILNSNESIAVAKDLSVKNQEFNSQTQKEPSTTTDKNPDKVAFVNGNEVDDKSQSSYNAQKTISPYTLNHMEVYSKSQSTPPSVPENTPLQYTQPSSSPLLVSKTSTPNVIRQKNDLQNGEIQSMSRSPKIKEITPLLPSEIETQYTPLSQFPLPKNTVLSQSVITLPVLQSVSNTTPTDNGLLNHVQVPIMDSSASENCKAVMPDNSELSFMPLVSDSAISTENELDKSVTGGVRMEDTNGKQLNNQDYIPNTELNHKPPSSKITNFAAVTVNTSKSKETNVNCNSNLDSKHKTNESLSFKESQPNTSPKKAGFGNLTNVTVTDTDLEQLGSLEINQSMRPSVMPSHNNEGKSEDAITVQLTNELASMDPFYNPINRQTSNDITNSDILSTDVQPSVISLSTTLSGTTSQDLLQQSDLSPFMGSESAKVYDSVVSDKNEVLSKSDPKQGNTAHTEANQNKQEAMDKSTGNDGLERDINHSSLAQEQDCHNTKDNTENNHIDDNSHHPPLVKAKGHPVTSYSNTALPVDPPSYQDVINSRQNQTRNTLTLNFEQPNQRKPSPQALQPSPIIDRVDDFIGAEQPQNVDSSSEVAQIVETDSVAAESAVADSGTGMITRLVDPESGVSALPNGFGMEDGNSEWLNQLVGDLSEEDLRLGNVAPQWIPDGSAPACMKCNLKFTFRKRRHHCRACGKVFCANCCNVRVRLKYMEQKESRVCLNCLNTILRAQAIQRMKQPTSSPDPRNPAEYCSTVPPFEQAKDQTSSISPTVMVPVSKSSLRRPVADGNQKSKGSKRVHFSDGLNPGDELVEEPPRSISHTTHSMSEGASIVAEGLAASISGRRRNSKSIKRSLIPKDGVSLPPVIIATETKGEYVVEENPNVERLFLELRNDSPNPVVFVLNKNLFVLVKIIELNCCVNRTCWCFSTKGMTTVGQDELVVVLESTPDEKTIPRDVFVHFNNLYYEASKGNTINDMSHSFCGDNFLGSRQHGGFLFLKPTFQCLQKLILPEPPYLFGVLLQKWEMPWAKVFPLRLMLRLGAEFRYYPCPLMSVRGRKPVYGEIGHTIMNLLADFKNYQYMLPQIPGITIHMQKKETQINFPNSKYDEIMKVISNSNEHVMALAANFSTDADSHLVCIQNEMANYQTQAINIQNKPRQVTGASFVVFNGALKASTGLTAKSSIVEDGVMVQIQSDMMATFRQRLREMKDFRIPCGAIGENEPEEVVTVKWIEETRKVNQGVKSPIDGKSMEGIDNIRIHHGTDFMGKKRAIRWTEVFFLESNEVIVQHLEPVDLSRLAETLATACCVALIQHLDNLKESGMAKIALRVTVDAERVGYEAGSNGKALPSSYMNSLDNEMIPVLHNAVSQFEEGPVIMELIFHIID